ncbi:neutral ceramidase-like [Paramacrobiotus metropolitanus]|uniref:neutral ceramidase-like n=1 Tax=Paramacrobiotus metropolitanus TaxID=2943436 RepID=UPI002445D869|nr:neutral ceramidase-like [Paramacrobiotus metropolitanus]
MNFLSRAVFALGALACVTDASYLIGVGKADVTGPVAEVGMMGYADLGQKTAGLLNRLYARAFIVSNPANPAETVVFVNCDLQAVFQQVHLEVIKQVKAKYGGVYNEQNIILHAQHTHAGPGGSSAYLLYDFTILGFIEDNFHAIVNGIVKAIDNAHNSLAPGNVKMVQGQVANCGRNRSPEAYLNNPQEERDQYAEDKDSTMTVLKFSDNEGKLRGVQVVYPVHPTSLNKSNELVSGDNKGHAAWLLEQRHKGVIAAVGISNAGDISPNMIDNGDGTFRGEGRDQIESTEIIGTRQADRADELIRSADGTLLTGTLVGKLAWVNFASVNIANTPGARTCPAVAGQNFAAGTEDGVGLGVFQEGDTDANPLFAFVSSAIKPTPQWVRDCQTRAKVPLLPTGLMEPHPWTPDVLGMQILRIGQLAIVSVPFEVSTMAGRRIRKTVLSRLEGSGVSHVEIAAISNGYSQYLTTREEYALQHYEGASTLFGPYQLEAVQQELARVADSIANPAHTLDIGASPYFFNIDDLLNFQTGVLLDDKPLLKPFGAVREEARTQYSVGQTASAAFYGGHPKNQFAQVESFCDVEQMQADGTFKRVMRDDHWDVRFKWSRTSIAYSNSQCEWYIRAGGEYTTGVYRFKHYGFHKSGWTGTIRAYEGQSNTFLVV